MSIPSMLEGKYTKSDHENASSNLASKLSTYLTCMNHGQSIRTSYQSLLTTLEVAVFGLVFTLYQLKLTDNLWLLPFAGIFLCIFFGVACEFRARNVDYWNKRIVVLVKETDLEDDFKGGKYGTPDDRHPFFDKGSRVGKLGRRGDRLFGHWFERILVSAMLISWMILLWVFSPSLAIRLLTFLYGALAVGFWITYAFRVIELREGKITIT